MYPHERSLVKRLQGKSFVLLGVNSDESKKQLKEAMIKENISWRSWWEGSVNGPIATRWNVRGWPMTYVLDAKGVIRYKYVRSGESINKAVDALLNELEDRKRTTSN